MSKRRPGKQQQQQNPSGFLAGITHWHVLLAVSVLVALFFRDILSQKAFFWEDFIYQYYPFRNFAAVALSHGELPLWNPYTFNGMPFQADIQTALFYIPNLLLTLFATSGKLNFFWVEFLIIAHFVLAGAGMYAFAKELGMQKPFALISGITFSLSGFMVMQLIHQTFVCQVAWLPLILLFVHRALFRTSIPYTILAGLTLGHAVLAGSPQFTVYIFLFVFFYFLFEVSSPIRGKNMSSSFRMTAIAAGVIVIAIAVTAIQLLPTIEMAPLSQRAEISFAKSTEGSLFWEQLITLIVPKYFGASGAQGSSFWLPVNNYWQYWETPLYCGLLPVAGMIAAMFLFKKQRYVVFFFGIGLFGILYALGDNFFLHSFFYHTVPGFDKFRVPGRMALYFTFAASILCGFGLQELCERLVHDVKKFQWVLFTLLGIGVGVWLLGYSGFLQAQRTAAEYRQIHEIVSGETTKALLLILVLGTILFLMHRRILSITAAVIVMIVFHWIDIDIYAFDQNNGTVNPDAYFSRNNQIVGFLKSGGEKEYFRLNARQGGSMLLDRNQGMMDRIFMMEGYTPLALQRLYPPGRNWDQVCDVLNAKYRITVDPKTNAMGVATSATYLPRAFALFKTKICRDETEAKSFMESSSFDPARILVLEEEAPLALTDTSDTDQYSANITSYGLNTIRIDATMPKNGYLVLSEMYYPGWHAYVDGTEHRVVRADWNLRAVALEGGHHVVEMRFEPSSFRHGAWITSGTLLISILGFAVPRIISRKNTPRESEQST